MHSPAKLSSSGNQSNQLEQNKRITGFRSCFQGLLWKLIKLWFQILSSVLTSIIWKGQTKTLTLGLITKVKLV